MIRITTRAGGTTTAGADTARLHTAISEATVPVTGIDTRATIRTVAGTIEPTTRDTGRGTVRKVTKEITASKPTAPASIPTGHPDMVEAPGHPMAAEDM